MYSYCIYIKAPVAEWFGVSAQAPSPASSKRAARFEPPTQPRLAQKGGWTKFSPAHGRPQRSFDSHAPPPDDSRYHGLQTQTGGCLKSPPTLEVTTRLRLPRLGWHCPRNGVLDCLHLHFVVCSEHSGDEASVWMCPF